jgi:hypothetical protein
MPSIPVTVDPKLAITSAEQKMALDKAFDDAFGTLDDKRKEPEPAPQKEHEPEAAAAVSGSELPAAEPKPAAEQGALPDTKAAPETLPATTATHPDDEPDEEVDKYKVHADTKPEIVATFRELRGHLKLSRKQQNELRQRLQKQEAELQGRQGQMLPVNDPTVQKELEELRGFRQRNAFLDDSTYHTNYEQPVRTKFDEIINEVKRLSPDPQRAADWEQQMRSAGPDNVGRQYWNEGLISQVEDPIDRDRMTRKVSELIDAQERRLAFRQKMSNDGDAYAKYQTEVASKYWDDFSREAADEARKLQPDLGEWANPKDLSLAKNSAEKAAFEAHNKAYKEFEDLFKGYLTDVSSQGPRGMTRVALRAVAGEQRKQALEAANKKISKLQGELEAARTELNKIAGARSRVAQPSTGARPNGEQPPPKRKASQSVDSAFRDFFGAP